MTSAAESYRLLVADVYELAGASRGTSEALARRHGQSVARWHVMSVLDGGDYSAAEIARRLGLARQSVARVADDLVHDGQAQKRPDPTDRRAPLLSLTRRGQETLRAIVEESDAQRVQQLENSGISLEELIAARATVRALLQMLVQ